MYATKLQGRLKMTFLALQISTLIWCYKQTESFSLSTKTYMSPLPLQVKHSVVIVLLDLFLSLNSEIIEDKKHILLFL